MGWLALVLTLLLEQVRPLPSRHPLHAAAGLVADAAEQNLNAGRRRHGLYAWALLIAIALVATGALYWAALQLGWWVALLLNVLVLYLTLGFRQFSHHFTVIQTALESGDLDAARAQYALWRGRVEEGFITSELDAVELSRQSMAHGLILAHRHVFGVLFWFVLLPGPLGPVLYRLAEFLSRRWNRPAPTALVADRFGDFARRAFAWIDWLPARLTALGFAIVGDFEGAIYCWRRVARGLSIVDAAPQPDSRTLLLAAAGGALGHRLLDANQAARYLDEAGLEGAGLAEPNPGTLRSAVGLVWRALILWLALLLLLSLAGWFG